jgi:hypothetical protein
MEPNLSRGCSAGSARPRRSSGVALGRWKLSAGRGVDRRAREAARGRKVAIAEGQTKCVAVSGCLEASSDGRTA